MFPTPATPSGAHPIADAIVSTARRANGSRDWMYTATKDDFGPNTNKCNKFVYDIIVQANARPLPSVPKYLILSRPPTAGEWANPNQQITGWKVVSSPLPGDVIAEAHHYTDASGHVGIVVGDKETASANANVGGVITINDWGFRADNHPTFRRFTG